MTKYLLAVALIFSNFGFGQINLSFDIEDTKRDDNKLYLWIYFKDKGQSLKKVHLSEKTITRRNKMDSAKDFSWYDLELSNNYVEDVLKTGANLLGQSRWFNAVSIKCNEHQLFKISQLSFVKEISPIAQYRRTTVQDSYTDRMLEKSSSLNYTDYGSSFYGESFTQLEQINVPTAHAAGYYGQGVTILLLDSGCNLDHPVFDSLNVVAEWDVVNDDSTTKNEDGQDRGDQHNHGTNVLSAMGGYAPGVLIGPAFKANYLIAKTEHIPSETITEEYNFIQGLEWGESLGADTMETSVGYTDWYIPNDLDGSTALVTKAVDFAVERGVICVASAGNENGNTWDAVTPPADAFNVISVGAVNNEGNIASWSSRGPTTDLRIKPEVCAMGVHTYCASGNGTTYYPKDGTSYAAPLVAGAAALVLNANPDWNPMEVREAFLETASQSQNEDNIFGWGIIDAWAAINYSGGSAIKPELKQNYPNPFTIGTTIKYKLKQSAKVKLKIFDIVGREVATLVNQFEPSGIKAINWNGKDSSGYSVSSGVYIYNLIVGNTSVSHKMLYIK